MLLPNEGIEFLLKHSNAIIGIFHFDFNQQNHFVSLSDDGQIIEWIFQLETLKITEIVKFHFKRPSDDILFKNKHKIRKIKKGEYYKITKVIQFDNYIALGYSDGVILVYEITKKQKNIKINNNIEKSEKKNKNENKEENKEEKESLNEEQIEENEEKENNSSNIEDKIESESNLNLNDIDDEEKGKNDKKNKNNKNEENIDDKNEINLDYYNFYSLYYVLLGHFQEIYALCYIPQTKMLISSSDDHTIKIFDFNTGHLKYYFKLDFIVNRILFQNISKNKNDSKIVLTLLSNDPVKVIINLYNNPITFNNYFFKHNDIIQLEKINDKFYGLIPNNIVLLDKNLELEGTFISLNNVTFHYFNIYKGDYLIVDNENCIRMVELIPKKKEKENDAKDKNKKNEKKKNPKDEDSQENEEKTFENAIITDCKFKVGVDTIKGFYYFENYIFTYCQDGKLYLVNYNKIKENYERMQMAIEDAASLQMMSTLVHVKKPKKKGKGKKGKDKKK